MRKRPLAHEVLPHHGQALDRVLSGELKRACEYFYDSAREAVERLEDRVRLIVPFEPDSNLVGLALNRNGSRSLARMNRFARRVFRPNEGGCGPGRCRTRASSGRTRRSAGRAGKTSSAAASCASWASTRGRSSRFPARPREEADHIFIVRHTLMNPFLMNGPGERSYINMYWDSLEEAIDAALLE